MPGRRISAAWVCPMDRPPIERGALLIDEGGRITALGSDVDVPRPAHLAAEAFPGAVLLPGLVNAHTHLELTGLEGAVPEADFAGWIRHLIALKAARSAEQMLAASKQGIRDGWAQGITTVADTGDSGAPFRAMLELGASGIAYQEVFGPHPALAQSQFTEFRSRFEALRGLVAGRVVIGVSPHAPYSVSGPLYRLVADWAATESLPLAVHVAESLEEMDLVASDAGAFAAQWRARGIPALASGGATPLQWLERHHVLSQRTLCIHAVRADDQDIARIARHGAAVAHCPRSNRRHAGRAAPVMGYLAAGVRLGVGTDSVASVAPLDLRSEARQVCLATGLSGLEGVELVTSRAAEAIGLADRVGTLTEGKWGDAAVVRLPDSVSMETLFDAVLEAPTSDVQCTVLGGRTVHAGTTA